MATNQDSNVADGPLAAKLRADGQWDPISRPRKPERCRDCGEIGERTGHMGCQYPQDHEDAGWDS